MEFILDSLSKVLSSSESRMLVNFSFVIFFALVILKVTKESEDILKRTHKNVVVTKLRSLKDLSVDELNRQISSIMEKLFGDKFISQKAFFMNSLISVTTFTILFFNMSPWASSHSGNGIDSTGLVILMIGAGFNVAVDFFSLIQTRWILAKRYNIFKTILIDFVLSLLISIVALSIFYFVFVILDMQIRELSGKPEPDALDNLALFLIAYLHAIVSLCTSFTTSLWVWLHAIAYISVPILTSFPRLLNMLNVDEKPMTCVGVIIAVYILLAGLPMAIFFSL